MRQRRAVPARLRFPFDAEAPRHLPPLLSALISD